MDPTSRPFDPSQYDELTMEQVQATLDMDTPDPPRPLHEDLNVQTLRALFRENGALLVRRERDPTSPIYRERDLMVRIPLTPDAPALRWAIGVIYLFKIPGTSPELEELIRADGFLYIPLKG